LAERGGFEPPVQVYPAQQISNEPQRGRALAANPEDDRGHSLRRARS
jgi:hypothetical protein